MPLTLKLCGQGRPNDTFNVPLCGPLSDHICIIVAVAIRPPSDVVTWCVALSRSQRLDCLSTGFSGKEVPEYGHWLGIPINDERKTAIAGLTYELDWQFGAIGPPSFRPTVGEPQVSRVPDQRTPA